MRLNEGGGQDLLSIPFLADAAPPAVMEVRATGSTTLEVTVHVRARPASAWLACLATTRYIINGYHEEDFEVWDETGQLVAQSRQLAKVPKTDTLRISAG
jgi:acyl-CoA thioesterase